MVDKMSVNKLIDIHMIDNISSLITDEIFTSTVIDDNVSSITDPICVNCSAKTVTNKQHTVHKSQITSITKLMLKNNVTTSSTQKNDTALGNVKTTTKKYLRKTR